MKEKNDQYDFKITEAQNEKYKNRNNSSALADIDLKLARLNKEADQTMKEYAFQNKSCFEVMDELIKS